MKLLITILTLITILNAQELFNAVPSKDKVPMFDSSGTLQKYYYKCDQVIVMGSDSFYYLVKDDVGDNGFVRKKDLRRCKGKVYRLDDSVMKNLPIPLPMDPVIDIDSSQILDPNIDEYMKL